jgi:short-subunit dehydrogenase
MNALVTGASAGIGKEMVHLLAQRGYHVVMVARRKELLEELARELPYGGTVIAQDLALSGAAQKLWETCRENELPIDVLVNNAGFGKVGAHHELDPLDLERMNNLNITCLSSLCRLLGDEMKSRGQGCILNVGSTASYLPIPYLANYAASKAFVNSFTRALRAELRPFGVQVSLLNPGPTATEFPEIAQPGGGFSKGRPHILNAPEVAEAGIVGMFADHAEIIPGPLNQALPLVVRLVPKSMLIRGASHFMRARLEG